MSMPMTIEITGLHKRFRDHAVLDEVNLRIQGGKCTLLSGVNGAGKSTLLRIIAGLERPDRCRIDTGHGPTSWSQSRAILQRHTLYLHQSPYMFDGSVHYNLRYALPRQTDRRESDRLIEEALEWAGLTDHVKRPAKTLSGGEQQRVALARTWLRRPRVLLLDEPIANLDQETRQRTLELLSLLKSRNMAMILASHDLSHFSTLLDHHLHLADTRLIPLDHPSARRVSATNVTSILRASA